VKKEPRRSKKGGGKKEKKKKGVHVNRVLNCSMLGKEKKGGGDDERRVQFVCAIHFRMLARGGVQGKEKKKGKKRRGEERTIVKLKAHGS